MIRLAKLALRDMKRTALLRRVGKAAKQAGVIWAFVRQGGNHEVWSCGRALVTIPRHKEINELTAQSIMKDLEGVLGEGLVEKVKTYRVVAERSGKWWAAHVPEVAGVHTQARRLEQVEAEAREALALMLEVEPDSIAVTVEPRLPDEVSALISALTAAHEATEDAQSKEREAARKAARALVEGLGLPQRDAGKILGVTHQRVQQILAGSGGRRRMLRAHAHSS